MRKTVTKREDVEINYGPEKEGWESRTVTIQFVEGECHRIYIEFLGGDLIPAHGTQISLSEKDLLFVHKTLHDAWEIIKERKGDEKCQIGNFYNNK